MKTSKMRGRCREVCYGTLIMLLIMRYLRADPLLCHSGDNFNQTLDNTVHLSDVILTGRIISVEKAEFGTYSAIVSYYYSYKSDDLLLKRAFSQSKVTNFAVSPTTGMIGIFFLVREPSMQLSLLCMTSVNLLLQNSEVSYQMVIRHIIEVGANDTRRNSRFVAPYPNPCDTQPCGNGAHCKLLNTLPGTNKACLCLTGFSRRNNTCHAMSREASESYCGNCTHMARCSGSKQSIKCTCDHFDCETNIVSKPLCASDGKSYHGVCQMRKASCQKQQAIYKVYDGNCVNGVQQMCMGMGHPLATSSGLFQCSADADNCPTKYFCHSTMKYNVCCPVLFGLEPTPPSLATSTSPPSSIESTKSPPNCKVGSGDAGSGADTISSGDGEDAEGRIC